MKKITFTFIFCLLVSITGFAQIKKVIIDVNGTFRIVMKVEEDAFVTIDSEGKILETEINGKICNYNSKSNNNIGYNNRKIERAGYLSDERLQRIGSTDVSYYNDGKVLKIGSTSFDYCDNSTGKIEKACCPNVGKISRIGSINFCYYHNNTEKIQRACRSAGKISEIGSTEFCYNSDGKLSFGENSFIRNGILFQVVNKIEN